MTPPTIFIVHPRERRSKCSVEFLRGREGFVFVTFPRPVEHCLDGYVRLGMGGPTISGEDADRGLLILDGTWKLEAKMEPFWRELPIRSLPKLETAYPRKSSFGHDPDGGLATIEALFAAYRLMGRSTDGLLDEYYWADEFLRRNKM